MILNCFGQSAHNGSLLFDVPSATSAEFAEAGIIMYLGYSFS